MTNLLLSVKTRKSSFLGIKLSTSVLVQKNTFFAKFYTKKVAFYIFQLFSTKNAENEDFDQHLGCAAPKRWSKYTTDQIAF